MPTIQTGNTLRIWWIIIGYLLVSWRTFAQTNQANDPSQITGSNAELLTIAEQSNYQATARYHQVNTLLDRFAQRSSRLRRIEVGKTVEGRSIPALVIADPSVATPSQASQQAKQGKLVILLLGTVHGNEVDGKEALFLIARDILTAQSHPWLKDFVLLFIPMLNADGNEHIISRPPYDQSGPKDGVGVRTNAQGLDLNRDLIKLEAPETRALVRVFNQWDPAMVIDTHTDSRTFHRYAITYGYPNVLAGSPKIIEYVRDVFLPAVSQELQSQSELRSFPYGRFSSDYKAWVTPPALPHYSIPYIGLRNRIGIFAEAYAYDPYPNRIRHLRDFISACLDYAGTNKAHIKQLLDTADTSAKAAITNRSTSTRSVVLRSTSLTAKTPVQVAGYVEEKRRNRTISTGQPKDYPVVLRDRQRATLTVRKPYAYIFPAIFSQVVELLQRHGITVEEFREDIEINVEAYTIDAITKSQQKLQGHRLTSLKVTPRTMTRRFNAGTILVRTQQKLGSLAAYLLEPQTEDGLVTWNFLDDALTKGEAFPIIRIPEPVAITSTKVRPLREERSFNKPLTYQAVFKTEPALNLSGSPVSGIQWLEDGNYFLQMKDNGLRKVHASTGRSSVFLDTAALAKALQEIPSLSESAAKSLANRAASHLSDDHTTALFNYENDLYYARLDGTTADRLTSTPQPEELATLSPDSNWVAFVRDHNLHVVDLATRTERALTLDGAAHILNGKNDWIYYEEVFNRNEQAYWWSPDSQRLAFFRTDNSMVKPFTLVNDLPAQQVVERAPYPRPGEPNPQVQLGMVTVAGGTPVFADLSDYNTESHLITGVGWWPDGSALYCFVQDRAQTWLDFCMVSAQGGKPTRLFRDQTKAWIEAPAEPMFLKDGSFLVTSERSGWQHLYHYSRQGKLLDTVTQGDWEVRKPLLLDESSKWIYFTGTKDNPIAEQLYRVHLNGSGLERLTHESGQHRITMSPDGSAFIDSWSSRNTPTKVAVRRSDGSLLRTLDTNPVYAREEYQLGANEQFQIKTADGFLLEAAWIKPPNFNTNQQYPVWFTTYAGPHAPSVSDSWGGGSLWDQVLAQTGIIVFHADPRPASGKGAVSAWTAYRQLGVQELKDISEAIRWLKTQPWIDGSRIGMSGYSYGGFMTAYALTHSDLFAAGIAGGSPTNWRDYDTIYTERYMLTPQDNPEGYEKTSVVKAAGNLHGRLMLVYGAIDDNVHPANTIKLIKALQEAGKQFEMMLYPGYRHGVWGKQYQRMQYEFILRTISQASDSTITP